MKALRMTEEEVRAYQAKRKGPVSSVPEHRLSKPEVPSSNLGRVHPSKLELRLDQQIFEAGLPVPWRNWCPIVGRNFELDRAWPRERIAVECQGGAHRIRGKFKADMEKRALCMLAGWRVLEVGGAEIRSGKAIEWLKQLLA